MVEIGLGIARKFHKMLLLTLVPSTALSCLAGVSIKEEKLQGHRACVIENNFFKAVLLPDLARFPYSYVNKQTGHEYFHHPVPLSRPQRKFTFYGGIADSLPWVDCVSGAKSFQDKGFLYTSPWKISTQKGKGWVEFRGQTGFWYLDPVTGKPGHLTYIKTIRAYDGSARLDMTQKIINSGTGDAKFTFAQHGRICIAGFDDADYLYAPGTKAYVNYIQGNPRNLIKSGIVPGKSVRWPDKLLTEHIWTKRKQQLFAGSRGNPGIFCFVPAYWGVAGDENHRESLWFISSPVRLAGKQFVPQIGILNRKKDYLLELCTFPCITVEEDKWKQDKLVPILKPGESCRYSITLSPRTGVSKSDLPKVKQVTPDISVLEPINISGNVISGNIASSANGTLELYSGNNLLAKKDIKAGIYDFSDFPMFSQTHSHNNIYIIFKSNAPAQTIKINRNKS